jgi:hypothetical protein
MEYRPSASRTTTAPDHRRCKAPHSSGNRRSGGTAKDGSRPRPRPESPPKPTASGQHAEDQAGGKACTSIKPDRNAADPSTVVRSARQLRTLRATRDYPHRYRAPAVAGQIFGRRSGISFQPSLTAAAVNACSALRTRSAHLPGMIVPFTDLAGISPTSDFDKALRGSAVPRPALS